MVGPGFTLSTEAFGEKPTTLPDPASITSGDGIPSTTLNLKYFQTETLKVGQSLAAAAFLHHPYKGDSLHPVAPYVHRSVNPVKRTHRRSLTGHCQILFSRA